MLRRMIPRLFSFLRDDRGVSAIEAGFVFPLLLTLLCGSIDTGVAVVVNQKMINAAQSVSDILAREDDIEDAELEDAIVAGRLALTPYPVATYGVDVAGIQFVGSRAVPTVIWRDTYVMEQNDGILAAADGLGIEGEGVLGVTVNYSHTPYFTGTFTGAFDMTEVAYARARRGLFITRTRG